MVNDIQATYMSNIRRLDPNSSSRPSSRSSSGPPPRPPSQSSTVMRDNTISSSSFQPYQQYQHGQQDDNSLDESSRSETVIMFVGHQYRYPKNSRTMSKVHYSYVTNKGKKWNIRLNNEQSIKPFYDTIVNRMNEAGILLKPWDLIVKHESLAVITEENCDNYTNAYKSMAQAIYNYLDDNKHFILKHYTIPLGFIEGYRTTGDGFKVLQEIISINHPALLDLVNSTEDAIKPTMEDLKSLLQLRI